MKSQSIIIYQKENEVRVEVTYENKTLWLNLNQISNLFDRDKSVISRHIKNIYKEEELPEYATVAKNATVQKEGKRKISRQIEYYNLDVILAVGYRVSSAKGTQFRIWANKILKTHLIQGFTTNKNRLEQLNKTIKLIDRTSKIETSNSEDLIDILSDYANALEILDDYDHKRIKKNFSTNTAVFKINYKDTIIAIQKLRLKFKASRLFGNEKDNSFKSSIAVIDQTFNGKDLYPSIEEKAANLLYLVVKNHSFTDGNKRIAAWLFIWYLNQNNFLYKANGNKKFENNTLVAITLMIALSDPEEKEIIISIIINLINTTNE